MTPPNRRSEGEGAILFFFFFFINLFIYLYLFFGCVGSSFLCKGFL